MLIMNNLVCVTINQMIHHVFMCAGYAGMYAWMDGCISVKDKHLFCVTKTVTHYMAHPDCSTGTTSPVTVNTLLVRLTV